MKKLVLILLLSSFLTGIVSAQDSKETPVTFSLIKYPFAAIPKTAKTFSVNWDIGSMQSPSFLELGNLRYSKENPDLKLNITIGNIKLSDPIFYERNKGNKQYTCWYEYKCTGVYSMEVTNNKDSVISKFKKDTYYFSTKGYNNAEELARMETKYPRGYAFDRVLEHIEDIISKNSEFYSYQVTFDIVKVDENTSEYRTFNTLSDSLFLGITKLPKTSLEPASNALIVNSLTKLKAELAKCNFDTKKGAYGKRVGKMILQNLIVGYMAIAQYDQAMEYVDKYNDERGMFSAMFLGKTFDKNYKGPGAYSNALSLFDKNVEYKLETNKVCYYLKTNYMSYFNKQ